MNVSNLVSKFKFLIPKTIQKLYYTSKDNIETYNIMGIFHHFVQNCTLLLYIRL